MKKEEVIVQIIEYAKRQKMKIGEKFPSERELSLILKTSRTIIREAVSILEERNVLAVKKGSGIYLEKSIKIINSYDRLKNLEGDILIGKELEASLMIVPIIIGRAAACAEDNEIEELQECIVKMSQAIVSKNVEKLVESSSEFHYILALMTKNYSFVKIMEHLNSENRIFWKFFYEK